MHRTELMEKVSVLLSPQIAETSFGSANVLKESKRKAKTNIPPRTFFITIISFSLFITFFNEKA